MTVGGAFAPPAEPYVMYWSVWGSHPSRTGQAEVALRVSDFSPTGGISNVFVATSAMGTIDVAAIQDHAFRLQLDIVATNETGESVRLQGPLVIRLQTQSASCFS